MTEVLFNIWAWTFLTLGFLYQWEGRRDPDHWNIRVLLQTITLALTPVLAQIILLSSLWEYGKYYTHRLYTYLFTRP